MTKRNLFITRTSVAFSAIIMIISIFTGAALADNINLNMEGSTATIPKGNTVERRIFNIPNGIPGDMRVKLKWHAVNIIPNTFNPLVVRVLHGQTIIRTLSCYSIHSNKVPKCDFNAVVTAAEAAKPGIWKLKVTNNSAFEVIGFDMEKGSDLNPLVPNFKSFFTPDCPPTVNLDMEGTTLTLGKGNTQERRIFGIGHAPGVLRLKAKWHAVNIFPTYNALKIQLLRPNGSIARTGTFYSVHSNKSPKFDITYNISQTEAAMPGTWKLRITNNSAFEVVGFNIEKESGELNPLVPNFFSSYKADCNF